MRFTEEELSIAKSADLCAVASSLGYTVKRVGKYHTLKEMDSIRIYGRTHWFRWSKRYEAKDNGGSQIDFLRVFAGMEIKEAVFWLLDFVGYRRLEDKPFVTGRTAERKVEKKKEFVLPKFAGSNVYLYRYLEYDRGISKEVIDRFVKAGLIYEAKDYHNIVFVGKDKNGTPRFASMRGVFDKKGKTFKCDVAGNDKRHGFHIIEPGSHRIIVFEAAIDMLSYLTLYPEQQCSMVALGMVADAPLETLLSDYPDITHIQFCLDNDEPGRKATASLMKKYYELGYEVEDVPPPPGVKDYNEWLVTEKASMSRDVISGVKNRK